jgi:hypothetical protein
MCYKGDWSSDVCSSDLSKIPKLRGFKRLRINDF